MACHAAELRFAMGQLMPRAVAKKARRTAIFVGEAADYGRLWLLCGGLLWFSETRGEGW